MSLEYDFLSFWIHTELILTTPPSLLPLQSGVSVLASEEGTKPRLSFLSYGHPQTGMSPILSGLWPLTVAPCCHHQKCRCYYLVAGCKALCCRGVPCHNHKILQGSPFSCSVSFQGLRSLGFSPMLFLAGCLSFCCLNFSAAAQTFYCSYTRGSLHSAGNSRTSFLFRAPAWGENMFPTLPDSQMFLRVLFLSPTLGIV